MNPADVRGLLFDLDGTLVDSAPDLAVALDRTLADLDLAPVGEEQTRRWVGNGAKRLVARGLTGEMWEDPDPDTWASAMDRFFHHYGEHLVVRTRLYPGVRETLDRLHAKGYRLGVVTNKPARFAEPLLEQLGMGDDFGVVLGGDSLGEKKPHPMPLLHAARTLDLSTEQLLMVGDSLNDVEAARRAGMVSVCVPYGYNHGQDIRASGADVIIKAFPELLTLLRIAA